MFPRCLHVALANARAAIESPPFEVSESGWGEFEIQLKIFFVGESNEKAVTMFHYLKLHPYNGDEAELELARQQRRPVLSYQYDEVVFNEPTEAMYEILTSKGTAKLPSRSRGARGEFVEETEQVELDRIGEGQRLVQEQIKMIREKLKDREKQMAELKKALDQ